MKIPRHLGGHLNVTHIDQASLEYLAGRYSVTSMYDVGCGPGGMVKAAADMGIAAVGIDGDSSILGRERVPVIIHDFTKGELLLPQVDLAWSCEFLEHVEEKYVDNYFAVFKQCSVVCCTYSTSHRGHHHVNVKDQQYWDDVFAARGFDKDKDATDYIRKHSSMKREFVRNTGTVYLNESCYAD